MGATSREGPIKIQEADKVQTDPFEMAKRMYEIAELAGNVSLKAINQVTENKGRLPGNGLVDPWIISKAFMAAGEKMVSDPGNAVNVTRDYIQHSINLWQKAFFPESQKDTPSDIISPATNDKRFRDPEWKENRGFNLMMQSYLLWEKWVRELVESSRTDNPEIDHKVRFYTRQLSDALSPANYPWGNPQVMKKTLETNGLNLLQGMRNLLEDFRKGEGQLRISMVDRNAFRVGHNIATTPGKVIFQNDLIQLIQYTPVTQKVYRIPILLVPPCINKFYIYDLRPGNSLVRWLLSQGFTVFMISWVNPDERLSHKTFEDYVIEGIGAAVDVACKICGVDQINAAGFCIGGNFLATWASYKSALSKAGIPLASATYFATLFDFENAGDLMVFIDEEQLSELEKKIDLKGYFDGSILAHAFNMLRANDLIWSFVINNYLMGQDPQAFDLLFWNSDSTNLPGAMYLYYLRNFFMKNLLIKPNGIQIRKQPIDLANIRIPSFVLNTREDHIAPWQCGYKGAQRFSGPTRFVLGGSGHIAGIFNHPDTGKYAHWTGDHKGVPVEEWLKGAREVTGSWWNEWLEWLKPFGGEMIDARLPGNDEYVAIEDAPGSYVLK